MPSLYLTSVLNVVLIPCQPLLLAATPLPTGLVQRKLSAARIAAATHYEFV